MSRSGRPVMLDLFGGRTGLRDALPPDYTRWIGERLIREIGR